MLRLRDPVSFHIIVTVTELTDNGSAKPRETLALTERPCSVFQRHCRLWSPEKRRDGYSIGRYAKQKCRLRGTCAHQNDATDSAEYAAVHYLVSPPRPPRKDEPHKPKQRFNGWRWRRTKETSCVALYMSRVAFIPRTQKKQSINAHNVGIIRNVYTA